MAVPKCLAMFVKLWRYLAAIMEKSCHFVWFRRKSNPFPPTHTENPEWIIWLIWAIVCHYTDKRTYFAHIFESSCPFTDPLWLKWVKWFTWVFLCNVDLSHVIRSLARFPNNDRCGWGRIAIKEKTSTFYWTMSCLIFYFSGKNGDSCCIRCANYFFPWL